jgi:hypothetical protein
MERDNDVTSSSVCYTIPAPLRRLIGLQLYKLQYCSINFNLLFVTTVDRSWILL